MVNVGFGMYVNMVIIVKVMGGGNLVLTECTYPTLAHIAGLKCEGHVKGIGNDDGNRMSTIRNWDTQSSLSVLCGGMRIDNAKIILPISGMYGVICHIQYLVNCTSIHTDSSIRTEIANQGANLTRSIITEDKLDLSDVCNNRNEYYYTSHLKKNLKLYQGDMIYIRSSHLPFGCTDMAYHHYFEVRRM